MERAKVYGEHGMPVKTGIGLFAKAFMEHFPRIPVVEDGHLHDPKLRENLIENIFALKRLRETLSQKCRIGNLVEFHSRNKLPILSLSQTLHRQMGKLVADVKSLSLDEGYATYDASS